MTYCTKCGSTLLSVARFCMECGQPIPELKKCTQCGVDLPAIAKFCFFCGSSVSSPVADPLAVVNTEQSPTSTATIPHIEALEKYKELLRSVCTNGQISHESNQLLYQAAFSLQISPREAAELRETIINETKGLSCVEKLELEEFDKEFESGLYANAYKRITPILERHGKDNDVITRYLRIVPRVNPAKAESFVLTLTTDISDAYLAHADSALLRGNLDQCSRILNEALAIWPENILLLYSKVRVLTIEANVRQNKNLLTEAENILEKCPHSDDLFIQTAAECAKAMIEYSKTKSRDMFSTLSPYWNPFISQLTNEISVSPDGSKAYTSIKDAIENALEGATISVYPGTYDEQIVIEKSIHIKGIAENEKNPVISYNHFFDQKSIIEIRCNNCIIENLDITRQKAPFEDTIVSTQLSFDDLNNSIIGLKVSGDSHKLENVNIYGTHCIGLEIIDCSNISLNNCNFFKNANSGAVIAGNCSGTFQNCFFAENDAYGKQLFGTNDISFENCTEVGNRFGYFTDPRDGETYGTVKIGNQTWMTENLRYMGCEGCCTYGDDQETIKHNGVYYSWCSMLNISDILSAEQSMVTYSKQLPYYIKQARLKDYWLNFAQFINDSKVQGIAPDGWRIPTDKDFTELLSFVQKNNPSGYIGAKFISTQDTQATYRNNITGFNAFVSGTMNSDTKAINAYGNKAKFWTSCMDQNDSTQKKAFCFSIGVGTAGIDSGPNRCSDMLNIRCILDDSDTMESTLNQVEVREKINSLLDFYDAVQTVSRLESDQDEDTGEFDEAKALANAEHVNFIRNKYNF